MLLFEKGQTFKDNRATNFDGEKGKYFIGMSNGEFEDDVICCFVMNTENKMHLHHLLCNSGKQKFIIAPKTFSFIINYTSIMLNKTVYYRVNEIINDPKIIELKDLADLNLSRQIKNCIDFDFVEPKYVPLIKSAFK